MTKMTLLAATIGLGVALAGPAFAGEGNGEPFPAPGFSVTHLTHPAVRDVGSAQYPNMVGRPGANLALGNDQVLPAVGSEQPVQTANSLPAGFENGTVTYAQVERTNAWLAAHNQPGAASFAAR